MILICLLYTCGVWIESVYPVADLCLTNQVLYGTVLSRTAGITYRVSDTSPRPRGCKNYPELPSELTEKLTGTAVRA